MPSLTTSPVAPLYVARPIAAPQVSAPSSALSASIVMPRRTSLPPKINTSSVHNRILALMAHTSRYAFKGESRLAADAGVSKSAVCRLLNGQSSPSFALVSAITRALEPHLQGGLKGKRLDPHELISLDGTYPTASACELAGCKGCLPADAYDTEGCIKPEFKEMKPGQWSLSPTSLLQPSATSPTTSSASSAVSQEA